MVINLFQMMRRPPPHEVEVGQSPGKQRPRHDHSWDQPCKNLSIVMEVGVGDTTAFKKWFILMDILDLKKKNDFLI